MDDQIAPVVVSFTLTRQEFLNVWRKLCTQQWRSAWRIPFGGVIIVLVGIWLSSAGVIGAGAFLAAWCLLASYALVPRGIWRRAEHGVQTHTFQRRSSDRGAVGLRDAIRVGSLEGEFARWRHIRPAL